MEEKNLSSLNAALTSEPDGVKKKYLTFWTDRQLFAIPILDVEQIIGMQEITPVPDYPEYVKGVINLRGTMIPVLDFRLRLGKTETAYNDHTCMIVINGNDKYEYLGYIVEAVEEVMDVADGQIVVPPKMEEKEEHKFVTGIVRQNYGDRERLVLCIDPVKVLETDVPGEMKQIIK